MPLFKLHGQGLAERVEFLLGCCLLDFAVQLVSSCVFPVEETVMGEPRQRPQDRDPCSHFTVRRQDVPDGRPQTLFVDRVHVEEEATPRMFAVDIVATDLDDDAPSLQTEAGSCALPHPDVVTLKLCESGQCFAAVGTVDDQSPIL